MHNGWVLSLKENAKALYEEWKQLDAKQKEPYERAALADAERHRGEVGGAATGWACRPSWNFWDYSTGTVLVTATVGICWHQDCRKMQRF